MGATEVELLIRMNALKDVEIWLHEQYAEINNELMGLVEDRNDDSALHEAPTKEEVA